MVSVGIFALFVVLIISLVSTNYDFTGFAIQEQTRYQQLASCLEEGKNMTTCRLELGTVSQQEYLQASEVPRGGEQEHVSPEVTCRVDQQKSITICLQELAGNQAEMTITQGAYRINENMVIPSRINIRVEQGAQFSLQQGTTLQIEGLFTGPQQTLFSGEGNVRFTNPAVTISPVWWGHRPENDYVRNDEIMKKVMDALPNGGTVELASGTFQHKLIDVANAVTLQGAGCTFNHDPECANTCNDGCATSPDEPNVPACCSTVIQLPDFPPNDEERYLYASPQNQYTPQENFIACKSGVRECTIRNLEYDGNAQRNRNWKGRNSSKSFPYWTNNDYDPIYAHGIYGGPFQGRRPPQSMRIENLYIHDTIRDGVVIGELPSFSAQNLRIKNSDIDHLIYISQSEPVSMQNMLLEGYWTGPAVVAYGPEMQNLFFKNIVENPLRLQNPKSDYQTLFLVSARSTSSPKRNYPYHGPTRIRGLNAYIESDAPSAAIHSLEAADIEDAKITLGPQRKEPFYFFALQSKPEVTSGQKMLRGRNIQVASTRSPVTILNTQGTLSAENVNIDDVSVTYTTPPEKPQQLVSIYGPTQQTHVQGVTITGAAQPLLATTTGISVSNITLSNVEMCDAKPEFVAHLNEGTDITLLNAKIRGFVPGMIRSTPRASYTTENVGDCPAER